jgi:hypothetical protein
MTCPAGDFSSQGDEKLGCLRRKFLHSQKLDTALRRYDAFLEFLHSFLTV